MDTGTDGYDVNNCTHGSLVFGKRVPSSLILSLMLKRRRLSTENYNYGHCNYTRNAETGRKAVFQVSFLLLLFLNRVAVISRLCRKYVCDSWDLGCDEVQRARISLRLIVQTIEYYCCSFHRLFGEYLIEYSSR